MIILRYSFVRDLAEITGRLIDLQGYATSNEIRNRIVEKWGDRSTVKRIIQMVTTTMKDFGFVESEKKGSMYVYKSLPKKTSNDLRVVNWFVEVLLRSHSGDFLPLEEISRQYCVFPFSINISITELYKNEKLDVRREGLDQIMVGIKN